MRARLTVHVAGPVALIVLGIVLRAAPAHAQTDRARADGSFATLERALRPGDTVTVTHLDGGRTKGRLIEVTDGVLWLNQDGAIRTIAAPEIRKVQRTRRGVLLGAIIGGGIGAGLGAAAASIASNETGSPAGAFLWVFGTSVSTGLGVDALVNFPRTVYEREHTSQLSLTPAIARGGGGIMVALRF